MNDAISRLAAKGAPTRPLMTAGFLAFATGMGLTARALRDAEMGRAWKAAAAAAVTTIGVAAFPLDAGVDGLHGVFAGAGYVALVAMLALAGDRTSRAMAAFAALCLALSTLDADTNGLFQRLGLTTIDVWLIALSARQLLSSRAPASRRSVVVR